MNILDIKNIKANVLKENKIGNKIGRISQKTN